uniref:Caspase-8 n=1 Tax=Pyxicephalus adspersus TaxID=30357 RepID=A0AAV2ZZ67_PYXAD|nr:TPA: hypothetical protein GDO54_015800 [Pyxicephalus adspersus]
MEKDLLVKEDNLEKLKKTLAVIGRQDLRQKILSCEKQEEQNCLSSAQEKMPIQENPTNEIKEDGSGKGRNLEQYTLDKNPHGWCVILNNEDFKIARNKNPKLNDRSGTNKDAEAIKRVFEKRHYIVEEHKNLTKQNMLDVMKEYGKKDHSQKDSFICFILSHGHTGTVLGVDGEEVPIRNLTSCFNGPNCYFLIGKPKIFFIQACQGGKFDTGVPYEEDSSTCTHESDGGSLPVTADFLTAYASTEGYVSLRDPTEGSVYIQNLCKALDDPLYIQEDLKDILTILQNDIADEVKRIRTVPVPVKQMPSYKSELRKKLILPPPENV